MFAYFISSANLFLNIFACCIFKCVLFFAQISRIFFHRIFCLDFSHIFLTVYFFHFIFCFPQMSRSLFSQMSRSNSVEVNGAGGNHASGTWTVGLCNARAKYLTAETFGFKINANGES